MYRDGHGIDRRGPRAGRPGDRPAAEPQLDQLRFLHRVAKLATTARTWDELLETIVDETRDALHGDVSSLYLLDRDGVHLTLAATNGLDRYQIGRARVPFGEGVTGRVAASREPMRIADVRHDPRFLWVRGIDQRRFIASMLSVPLSWHEGVVGVLNIQTEETREFSDSDVAQLSAIADLLAGIVEKGRTQREAEAQVEALKAIDEARTELIAMVTHELRTPLAVVRAYTDLLSEEPPLVGRESRDLIRRRTRDEWHNRAIDQIDRLDRLVDSILASVRPLEDRPSDVVPVDVAGPARRGRRRPAAAPAQPPGRGRRGRPPVRPGRSAPPPPGRRAPRRERGQVRPAGDDDQRRRRRSTRASSGSPSRTRGRASRPSGESGSSSPTRGATRTPRAAPGSGCSPPSGCPSRWMPTCGASRPSRPGARFVIALPAAVAV